MADRWRACATSSEMGRLCIHPLCFLKSAQALRNQWVENIPILGVRKRFVLLGVREDVSSYLVCFVRTGGLTWKSVPYGNGFVNGYSNSAVVRREGWKADQVLVWTSPGGASPAPTGGVVVVAWNELNLNPHTFKNGRVRHPRADNGLHPADMGRSAAPVHEIASITWKAGCRRFVRWCDSSRGVYRTSRNRGPS